MIADAETVAQDQQKLLRNRESEIQLKILDEERKRETADAISKATLKEARQLLRKKAEEIDLARDALLSKQKQQAKEAGTSPAEQV